MSTVYDQAIEKKSTEKLREDKERLENSPLFFSPDANELIGAIERELEKRTGSDDDDTRNFESR